MKAFKEQINRLDCPVPDIDCGTLHCTECEKVQAAIWRGALNWVRKLINEPAGRDGEPVFDEEILSDLRAALKKELKDGRV